VACAFGVPAKKVCYYESIGLTLPATQSESDYLKV